MLLPPLCIPYDYVRFAEEAGLGVFAEPLDISDQVSKTWYPIAEIDRLSIQLTSLGMSRGR